MTSAARSVSAQMSESAAARLPKVGFRCVEEVDSGGGVGEDRGEWLGYFVHNGCGELAKGGHACDVLQLCPLLLEFLALQRG